MHSDTLLLNDADQDLNRFAVFIFFSLVFHVVVFSVIMFTPSIFPHRRVQPSVINVDLVSLDAAPAPSAPEPVQQTKPQKVAPEAVKVPEKKQAVPPKDRVIISKKKKRALKKKDTKPVQTVDQAIADMKKKVAASEAEALKKRMSQLANQVQKEGRTGSGYGGSGTKGAVGSDIMNIYKAEILYHIQKNWSFLDNLINNRTDLEVKIGIKIMPDGEIRDVWFDKRSGNAYFDEQAEKAVKKTKRLPPLPQGFSEPFLNQGLRFTPQGIN